MTLQPQPLNSTIIHAIALELLQNPNFGLCTVCQELNEYSLVNRLTELISLAYQGIGINYDEWVSLEKDCLKLIGSSVANCVAQIVFAERNPSVALSELQDASHKLIQINVGLVRKRIKMVVQTKIQNCINNAGKLEGYALKNNSLNLQSNVDPTILTVKPDIKESEGFKAFLTSKKERSEVYRRLAES